MKMRSAFAPLIEVESGERDSELLRNCKFELHSLPERLSDTLNPES
jgi:hypothetical protein